MTEFDPENRILYNWESTNNNLSTWWNTRRKSVDKLLSDNHLHYADNIPQLETLGKRIRDQGQAERAKEIDFLRHTFPDLSFDIDDRDLIHKLNTVINGSREFGNAVKRIQNVLKYSDSGQKTVAPTIAALFGQQLQTSFYAQVRDFVKSARTLEIAANAWKDELDTLLENAIDDALQKAWVDLDSGAFGEQEDWSEIISALTTIQSWNEKFKGMLKRQLISDDLRNLFTNSQNRDMLRKIRRNKKEMGGLHKYVRWSSQGNLNRIGGNVQEYITAIVKDTLPTSVELTEKGTHVIEGKQIKTDELEYMSYDAKVTPEVQNIAAGAVATLSGANSLRAAADAWEHFYEENLAHLSKDTYVILSSDKMAALNEGFRGLHGSGDEMQLERLPDYIDSAGINVSNAHDFLMMAYNTLPGAKFEDERAEVSENIRNILTSAVARLLFDDWSTIGVPNSGAQILNFFNIDGIIVPSSYFFIHLGDAIANTARNMHQQTSWLKIRVKLPKTVTYHSSNELSGSGESKYQDMLNKWNEQMETARKESTFEVMFLLNLRSELKRLL